jgi:mono/diheme cytochrome c family protein
MISGKNHNAPGRPTRKQRDGWPLVLRCALGMLGWALLSPAQSQLEQGQALYTEHCAACHGATAEGASAPDLTNPRWQARIADAGLDRILRDGVVGRPMPPFGATLDATARGAVIAHLRELSKRAVQPTTQAEAPPVSAGNDRLLAAANDTGNWLLYGRDYGNQRFSPLDQIHRGNVQNLAAAWSFQTGVPDGLHASPLVIDGVLYLSTAWNHVFAIDARTGAELWHYRRQLPQELKYCCGPVNWGVAILDGTLFLGTLVWIKPYLCRS